MQRYYSIKEIAEYLGIAYTTSIRYINYCQLCNQSQKKCTCKEFSPRLKSIDLNKGGKRKIIRVSVSELDRYIRRRRRRHDK